MRIVHIAVWTRDLETMRVFYERYFGGRSGEKYVNRAKGFESYMVRLGDTALELMRSARIADRAEQDERIGFCHIAVSTGSAEQVRDLTERLRQTAWKSQSEKHGSKKTAHRIHGNARLRGIPARQARRGGV